MSTFSSATMFYVIFAVGLLSAAPARAAVNLEPGMWQVTETGDENGQLLKPVVASDCITAEDAKEPFKALTAMKNGGAQCKKLEIKEIGNVVSVDLQCGDGKETSVEMSGTYTFLDQRHYNGTIKSTTVVGRKKTVANKAVDMKWIGACEK